MSLILDALRKSEAERRRAQAPDLFSEPALALPPRQAAWPHWKWATLAVVGVLVCLLLLRAVWPTANRTALAYVPDSTQPAPAASVADLQSAIRTVEPVPLPVHMPVPAQLPIPPPVAASPAPQPRPAPASAAAPTAVAPQEPAPAQAVASTAPIAQPRTAPEPDAAPMSAAVSEAAPASSSLRLADLGTEERQQLPPLKLSMHLWNDAPAQRFVILDGQRLGEGDRIGDAVVERITREGAILAWRGRRLSVSMR